LRNTSIFRKIKAKTPEAHKNRKVLSYSSFLSLLDKEIYMKTRRNLIIFTVLVLALSWLGKWVDIQTQSPLGNGPGSLIWIVSPLLISFLLRGLAGDGWKDLGIRPNFKGNGLWYLISILAYPVCIILIVGIDRAFGVITFSELSDDARALLVQGTVTMLIMQSIKNICEMSTHHSVGR